MYTLFVIDPRRASEGTSATNITLTGQNYDHYQFTYLHTILCTCIPI